MTDSSRIARRFNNAAASYDAHSALQRHAAQHLAELIERARLPAAPRILEIGCGTGHLTEQLHSRFADANYLATDIAPAMVSACRRRLPGLHHAAMDGERPATAGGFDLVCSSLTAQWFRDLPATIARLTELLAPGGVLALALVGEDTFGEWRAAHRVFGLQPGTPQFPSAPQLRSLFPAAGQFDLEEETHVDRQHSPLDFLRTLRGIGADTPAPGHRPLSAGDLRRVLRQLGDAPAITYHLLYAAWRKPPVQAEA
jgi:malonyl-CoA O-methyltransferase